MDEALAVRYEQSGPYEIQDHELVVLERFAFNRFHILQL